MLGLRIVELRFVQFLFRFYFFRDVCIVFEGYYNVYNYLCDCLMNDSKGGEDREIRFVFIYGWNIVDILEGNKKDQMIVEEIMRLGRGQYENWF